MAKVFTTTTNMQGMIVFGGEASSDFGMVVAEAPTFERPTRKNTTFTVPGRNGAVIFQQDAWDDVVRSYEVWLANSEDQTIAEAVDAFEAWLNSLKGYQRLEDSFEPDVFRLAYFNGGINFSNEIMQAGKATLSFTCRPERFYKTGEAAVTVTNGTVLKNLTRFTSKPLIYLEGTGVFSIYINGEGITAVVDDYIYIDCEKMNAYRTASENMNNKIGGTFPSLVPGDNTVTLVGTPTLAKITPRYFTV